jgi:hypothetical protein
MAASGKRRKAKQVTRAKKGAKKQRKKTAPDAGPVSLAEAKALAQAKHPKLAVRPVRESIAPPTSPAAVGAERERLEKERRDEFTRRVREYKATMEIMKKRGARRPRPKKSSQTDGRRSGSGGRIVRSATDFRRRRFMVRLSCSVLWRRDHPPPRNSARRSDFKSCESGRRGPLYAWRRGTHHSHRTAD